MIRISENSTIISEKVIVAKSFFSRAKGLLGYKSLSEGTCMLISPCNSIHTFFMRFTIDAVFISRQNEILKIIRNLKPWRFSPVCWKAKSVIELPGGTLQQMNIQPGMHLEIATD